MGAVRLTLIALNPNFLGVKRTFQDFFWKLFIALKVNF